MAAKSRIVFTFLSLLIFSCSETKDSFYSNITEVRRTSAIDKGWIPPILPESSSEIRERHLIDSNRVWLKFKFDKADIESLIDQLELVKPDEIDSIEFTNPRISWWPKEISKGSFIKGQKLSLYKYSKVVTYSDDRQKLVPAFFAIDWDSNTAYYWQSAS